MATRRHHYIWRNYLRPWAVNEKIWCLRNGKIFPTNLMNVGQERDFYAVKNITDNDVRYVLELSKHRHEGVLAEHNSEFIDLYRSVSSLHNAIITNEEIIEILLQFEEDIMSSIENTGIEYLRMLYDKNVDFFDEDEHRSKFSFFIMIQFVRTKRIYENIKKTMSTFFESKSVNMDNIWSVEKYIDAGHMALSLYSDRKYKIHLLKNATEIPFITSDQPIFNTYAVGTGNDIPRETEFYYPISPTLAALISKNGHDANVSTETALKFNSFVKIMSYEQIYASSKEHL